MKRICVTYTSHKDFCTPCKEYFTKTFTIDDDQAAALLLELNQRAPFTAQEALFMGSRANALSRLLRNLEELHGRLMVESDKILEITEAET